MSEVEFLNICSDWRSHLFYLRRAFSCFYASRRYSDVILGCDGGIFQCHRVILSALSPYFERILAQADNCSTGTVFVQLSPEVKYCHMVYIIQYIYHGEFRVARSLFLEVIRTARYLEICGLCDLLEESGNLAINPIFSDTPPSENSISSLEQEQQSHQNLPQLKSISGLENRTNHVSQAQQLPSMPNLSEEYQSLPNRPNQTHPLSELGNIQAALPLPLSAHSNSNVSLCDLGDVASSLISTSSAASSKDQQESRRGKLQDSANKENILIEAGKTSSRIIRHAYKLAGSVRRQRHTTAELKTATDAFLSGKSFVQIQDEMNISANSLRSFMKRRGYSVPVTCESKRKKIIA